MILTRLGNKRRIAKTIIPYFPEHEVYIEPFFGGGGMFFNKPKAKYNIVNDNDSEVFNLFQVVNNDFQALEKAVYQLPICEDLWNYWKQNQEADPVKKAIRFLLFSNFSYMGAGDTMRFGMNNTQKILHENIEKTHDLMFGTLLMNVDFRKVFKKISFKKETDKQKAFVYCDPPYLETTNNYQSGFNQQDCEDLFQVLVDSKMKFAVSEFDNPFVLEQAQNHNLNIIEIGERVNMKNRRTEILITNYSL
jgi:DNA adenine methylase